MGVVKFEGGGGALILGRKMRVDWLEKCLKVGKLTKVCAKVAKSGGIALVEVGEMCKTLEKLG